jgi:hypothetical protein
MDFSKGRAQDQAYECDQAQGWEEEERGQS